MRRQEFKQIQTSLTGTRAPNVLVEFVEFYSGCEHFSTSLDVLQDHAFLALARYSDVNFRNETFDQFLLKFIISHPAVTLAIPATRQVQHVLENKSAERGPLPDAATRQKMIAYYESL